MRGFVYLVVLAQVGPHAGSVSSAHQNVVGEEVDPGDGAREPSGGGVVVVSQVGHHVVKLKHLVALVLLLQARVKGDPGHRAVRGRADCAGSCAGTRRSRRTGSPRLTPLSRWSSWTGWPRLPRSSPWPYPARTARFPFGTLDESGKRAHEAAVWDCPPRGGAAWGPGSVWIAHHSASAQHLVVCRCSSRADQNRDQNDQKKNHDNPQDPRRQEPLPAAQPRQRRALLLPAFGRNGAGWVGVHAGVCAQRGVLPVRAAVLRAQLRPLQTLAALGLRMSVTKVLPLSSCSVQKRGAGSSSPAARRVECCCAAACVGHDAGTRG